MLQALSVRLLSLLQLTRMALVFTGISNSLCALLLAARSRNPAGELLPCIDWRAAATMAAISTGLYGFGMSLNDIVDRRRDLQLAAHRPLPSGRISLVAAHVVCITLGLGALAAAAVYSRLTGDWRSMLLAAWTMLLIFFYNVAGKYLPAIGLLTLGFIRFFHALIAAPDVPLIWHPLTLFTHVAVLSAVAYVWEDKRPLLTRLHAVALVVGVCAVNLLGLGLLRRRWAAGWQLMATVGEKGLLAPAVAGAAFIVVAWIIRRRSASARQAGQTAMLTGLLWLIVYDSAFALGYLGVMYALALLSLAPLSYGMVLAMRWWSKAMMFSQPPQYRRLREGTQARSQ